jgi:hypothetical protein
MKEKEVKRRPAAWFVTTPLLALALGGFIGPHPGHSADVVEEVPSAPDAVKDLPPIPNLDKFIKSEVAAIRLGKALFWDMQAGSDGQACASCHFHAGADSRAKNQLTPGLNAGDVTFQPTASGNLGGPNYTLVPEDFPFHQKVDELNRALGNNVAFDTNDGASSQGVFNTDFIDVVSGDLKDDCAAIADDIFHIGINHTRRVEPRQTPTVINAALKLSKTDKCM